MDLYVLALCPRCTVPLKNGTSQHCVKLHVIVDRSYGELNT